MPWHEWLLPCFDRNRGCSFRLLAMDMGKMNKDDLKTIACGLLPDGMMIESLTPKGKQELRDAIDALLRQPQPKYRTMRRKKLDELVAHDQALGLYDKSPLKD